MKTTCICEHMADFIGAKEVARAGEEAGHPERLTPEVSAQWISTDYVLGMHQALAQQAGARL